MHAPSTVNGVLYEYDANGNMVSRTISGEGSYSLTYDGEDRLVGVSGSKSASYVYDGDGKLVQLTLPSGAVIRRVGGWYEYQHNPGGGTASSWYYAHNGVRIAVRRAGYPANNGLFWLLTDHLGGTAVTLDAAGNYRTELRYLPYGKDRYNGGGQVTVHRYTGQLTDYGTGLYWYRSRWYDPYIGRFLQPDTIVPDPGNPQDLNRYAYALNNPLRYTDPSGHAVCVDTECAWIVHPVSGEIRQRAPTNSPPESPQAYSPAESYQEAMGLFNEFRSNMGPFEREFGPTHSLTQDIMYSPGVRAFHRVWAEAGYPSSFEWEYQIDVRDPREGPYPVRFIKSLPVYIGAQVKLGFAAAGLGSKTPEGPVDAVDGTIGSFVIRVKRVGPGWVKFEVSNQMNWKSGLRVPGGDYSLWKTLDSLKVPGRDSTLGDVWMGIVGGSHETEQTFYWWEPIPRSR